MSNLTLQLDGEALREATAQAILGTLTPEVRAKLLERAVQEVLAPSTDSWRRGQSPLDIAFRDAVEKVAHAEAKRLIEEDGELTGRIKELLRVTADRVLNADQEKLTARMADAFVASMRSRD